ncbi:hypothetical protein QYE76_016272 [Lolium multiflorum]|uniref:Uncharacterized protein n=1 Tax=Lolium multiflorum TaxID=4521 RepID=A0AAD8X8I5_LOLMU|nr:hypothetical protein QYE76_016272 [Lolium multiflorum]
MTTTYELRIKNDRRVIDIAAPDMDVAATGRNSPNQTGGGEIHTEWLRELTSVPRNAAVLKDLISRTPALWFLGERPATILWPRSRRASVKALHTACAVAIGPYHRGDRGLAFDEESKLPFLRYLREQCGIHLVEYVAALGATRGSFRNEFADDAVAADLLQDEEKFVKMLLLYSSFVLVFVLMFGRPGAAASFTMEHLVLHSALAQHADEIRLDLLVLENQVPFAAVKLLAASCRRLKLRSIEELVLGCFDDIPPRRARGKVDLETTDARFYHVLHLFHWSRVPENKYRVLSMPLKLLESEPEPERLIPCARELQNSRANLSHAGAHADPELGGLAALRMLWLAGCNLGGSIPPSLGQLDVSRNALTEPTPPQIAGLMSIVQIDLYNNYSLSLSGPILKSFGKLVEFMSMDAGWDWWRSR